MCSSLIPVTNPRGARGPGPRAVGRERGLRAVSHGPWAVSRGPRLCARLLSGRALGGGSFSGPRKQKTAGQSVDSTRERRWHAARRPCCVLFYVFIHKWEKQRKQFIRFSGVLKLGDEEVISWNKEFTWADERVQMFHFGGRQEDSARCPPNSPPGAGRRQCIKEDKLARGVGGST